jgi:hypothetical protein
MPSAEQKQRGPTELRGKTKKQRARQTKRSERTSNLALECFLRGDHKCQNFFPAKVVGKMGGGRFTIEDDEGNVYKSMPILGSLRLKGRATRNVGATSAIGVGDDVLTDAKLITRIIAGREETFSEGTIYGVLTSKEAKLVREKVAANKGGVPAPSRKSRSRSRSGSASTIFNWGSNRSSNSIASKLAARKRKHKHTKKANHAANNAVSAAASAASSVASAGEGVLLVAGKKVYDAAGEKLHGEQLRQAKRELAAAVAAGAK